MEDSGMWIWVFGVALALMGAYFVWTKRDKGHRHPTVASTSDMVADLYTNAYNDWLAKSEKAWDERYAQIKHQEREAAERTERERTCCQYCGSRVTNSMMTCSKCGAPLGMVPLKTESPEPEVVGTYMGKPVYNLGRMTGTASVLDYTPVYWHVSSPASWRI